MYKLMTIQTSRFNLVAFWVLSTSAIIACQLIHRYNERRQASHDENEQRRRDIEAHMLKTQIPARILAIRASSYNATRLTLRAPLSLNHNVHGTAFAGSLYSVAVLASFYLAREWLRQAVDVDPTYILVARAGSIRYLKPVTSKVFEATSTIPDDVVLQSFRQDLKHKRKAIMSVDGEILQERDSLVACRYAIEICAYYDK